jgi:glutaminyl-peptide cyclotransferase
VSSARTGFVLALAVALAGGLTWSACTRNQPGAGGRFLGDRALADVATQLAFGPRPAGSPALARTADWIEGELSEAGWATSRQEFEFRGITYRNLLARLGPSGEPPILLGTHYDTRPFADQDPVTPDLAVPGANDGASGVAVLLELARVLPSAPPDSPVWLAFFDGEDGGRIDDLPWIIGSTAFADSLDVTPKAVVIVDMVGDADLQLPVEANSDPELAAEIWGLAAEMGMPAFQAPGRHRLVDDHLPFLELGVPAVDIVDFDYPYWHTTQDTLDKVSAESLEQVGRVLEAWLAGRR